MNTKREEIIQAFDNCLNGHCNRACCVRFDSDNTVGHKFCRRKVHLEALALLKELTKENGRLNTLLATNISNSSEILREAAYEKGYKAGRQIVVEQIFADLFNKVGFDGHNVTIFKNELIEVAKKYRVNYED